jgi:hydrophobe/amphiphile efflux-1 (HAE1) family protein
MNIIRFFVDRRVTTLLLALCLLVFGLVGWVFLPVASLPDVEYPMINVTASLPGASAQTMAAAVAAPLERQLAALHGVETMKSFSYEGVTTIQLRFTLERKIDAAGADVQAAINNAGGDLPRDLPSPPTFSKKNPADRPIVVLAFTSNIMTTPKINSYVDNLVVRKIDTLDGVSSAFIADPQKFAVRVELNPLALAARGVSPEDVRAAIARTSINIPKGKLTGGEIDTDVEANDQLLDADAFRQVVVAQRNGGAIHLGDVAVVRDGVEEERDFGWFQGEPAIIVGIIRRTGANVVSTVDRVRSSLRQIGASIPPAIRVNFVTDRAEVIRASLRDVQITLAMTIALVVLVIFAFLRRLRATIIPALTIPLSLIGTCGVMALLHFSLDNLSLMALTISVGFVVDDAIVVIENVTRHLEAGMEPLRAAVLGGQQVVFTIISITLSLVAVFVPIFFMGGVVGRLFHEFAATVSIAIIISSLVALTLIPMLCRWLLVADDAAPSAHTSKFTIAAKAYDRVFGLYRSSVIWMLGHRAAAMAVFAFTLAATTYLYVTIPKGFLPPQDNGRLLGNVVGRPGMTFEEMTPVVTQLRDILRADPDVSTVTNYVNPDVTGEFVINLRPRTQRRATAQQVMTRLRDRTARATGASFYMKPEPELTFDANLGHAAFSYVMVDPNRSELERWAPVIESSLSHVPGILDVSPDNQTNGPALHIVVNRELASRLGVDPQGVDDVLYDSFSARRVSEIYTDSDQFYVIMEVAKRYRADVSALDAIRVSSKDGRQIPLSNFAHFEAGGAPLAVLHTGRFPSRGMTFNLAPGLSLGEALSRIDKMEHEIGKPPSLQTSFEGAAKEFQKSLTSQLWLVAAAAFVIYVILGTLYESFVHPLTILSSLPSAGLGALIALRMTGMSLDMIGVIGLLLLMGIVKKNAIMMIDFAIQAEAEGKSPEDAILQACLVRFRPIMMTTIAALFGALPLALGEGAGSELRRPLGVTIIGGLAISQFLTLYSTPVIHLTLRRFVVRPLGKRAVRRSENGGHDISLSLSEIISE